MDISLKTKRIKVFKDGWPFEYGGGRIETIGGSKGSIRSEWCKQWIKTMDDVLNHFGDDIKIINELGCGDLNWIKHTKLNDSRYCHIDYLGYDLIPRCASQTSFFKIHPNSIDLGMETDIDLIRNCDLTIIKDTICIMETSVVKYLIECLKDKVHNKYLLIEDYHHLKDNEKTNENITKNIVTQYNISLPPFSLESCLLTKYPGNISLYKL